MGTKSRKPDRSRAAKAHAWAQQRAGEPAKQGRGARRGRAAAQDSARSARIGLAFGWALTGAGALAVPALAVPPLPGTVGPGLTFVPDAQLHRLPGVGNWLGIVIVFGTLIGFNLVYFCTAPSNRRRHLVWLLVVYGVEMLVAVAATLWLSGAGINPGSVIDPDSGPGIGFLGVCQAIPAVAFVAAAIMTWLSLGTDFDRHEAEYFSTGGTKVNVRPRDARTLVWTLAALTVLWLLFLLPVLPAAANLDGAAPGPGATQWPWPLPNSLAPQLIDTLTVYLVIVATAGGFVASVLASKLLYARPLAAFAQRSRGRNRRGPLRVLLALRHVPFILAAIEVSIILTEPATRPDALADLPPSLLTAVVLALVGLLMISQAWRVRDLTAPTLRLHQGPRTY